MPTPTGLDENRMDRDRDDEGRARSARPRDELGRPLPPGSAGVERIPEELDLPPEKSLAWAQDLLDRGRAFHAHEVLEAAWKSCPTHERELWQGLAQLAVGITHIQRGNAKGAIALLRRSVGRIEDYEGPAPHRIDAHGLIAYANGLVASVELGYIPAADRLVPRLVSE